jgi:hypothetical protein
VKRNAGALLILLVVFLLVVGLNFAFFVEERSGEENEATGNRSSYRATPYGTKAYYTLLEESGYPVTRFEKAFTALKADDPGTLVVISPPDQNPLSAEEVASLTRWVEGGGLLVVIDRVIDIPIGEANIKTESASSQNVRVYQPTRLTKGVERISLSDIASRVQVRGTRLTTSHIGDDHAPVLADVKIGAGRIILLADPHVVANNGISERDNLVLALNMLADRPDGRIAFDEFHHGYGSQTAGGGLMAYFRGTPVPWMFWQLALVGGLAVYTLGRRFARPIPLKHERRTTNLEFVSSLANITRLARASDLAMQNIYVEFRKRLCKVAGLPPTAATSVVAAAAARRAHIEESEMRRLLARCEAIAEGKQVSETELLKLVTQIRELESKLGIH